MASGLLSKKLTFYSSLTLDLQKGHKDSPERFFSTPHPVFSITNAIHTVKHLSKLRN